VGRRSDGQRSQGRRAAEARGQAVEGDEHSVPTKKVYVASSKRNLFYPAVVIRVREAGFKIYDWSNPPLDGEAVDPEHQHWTCAQYIASLRHPIPYGHFESYAQAIAECDACVLLLPAGTNAHCEATMASLLGKLVIVCFADRRLQRELIHCQFDPTLFVTDVDELMPLLATVLAPSAPPEGLTDEMMLHPGAEDRGA
jgi:hypothetical protein